MQAGYFTLGQLADAGRKFYLKRPLWRPLLLLRAHAACCEDRVLDRPASGKKGSTGIDLLDCIWGKGDALACSDTCEGRLWSTPGMRGASTGSHLNIQGYLAYKKMYPRRTLPQAFA